MDPCLKAMLTQTVNVKTPIDYDGPNEVLGDVRAIAAQVQQKRSVGGAPGGTELTFDTVIFTEAEITVDDRIWLPGLDPTNEDFSRQAKSVFAVPDPEKPSTISHYETVI